VSAFAPIVNPTQCAWGQKAFGGYFGDESVNAAAWKAHDATELVKGWKHGPLDILIDVVRFFSFLFPLPVPLFFYFYFYFFCFSCFPLPYLATSLLLKFFFSFRILVMCVEAGKEKARGI
jgi:hypothetical protein